MKPAGLSQIKNELGHLSQKELADICLALARYRKDNKEYLDFLLFEAGNKEDYIASVKEQIDEHFMLMRGQINLYYVKKSLQKTLRLINRYIKYVGEKPVTIDLLIYFCLKLKRSGIPFHESRLIVNIYDRQIKKINSLLLTLHEDLRADYMSDLEELL